MASRMGKIGADRLFHAGKRVHPPLGGENNGLHQHPPTPNCVVPIADSSENIRHACGGILDFSPRPSLALSDVAKDGEVCRYKT